MYTPLHIQSFNQKFSPIFWGGVSIFPLACALFGFAHSWRVVALALVHYILLTASHPTALIIFRRLSLSLQSSTITNTTIENSSFGCLILLSNLAGPFLSLWFGWYSTLAIIVSRWLILFTLGYKDKHSLDKLIARMGTSNHLDPDGKWIIAVSRRFNLKEVDDLYYNQVLPILNEYGMVLECLYADNSSEFADFWMTRMGLILEIADIHILMEHFPSVSILHEQDYSDSLQARKRGFLLTHYLLGLKLDDGEIDRFVPAPISIRLSPFFIEALISMKIHLAIKGENRRFSSIFKNKLDRFLKLVNILYIEMNLPDKLSKSIHSSYPERKQLAALMQVEETARQITNNLLEKISNPDNPTLKNNRNALLVQNKYHEFLLQIRAKEKVIPRNYLESFALIKNLVFDGPTGSINLDGADESSRFIYKILLGSVNIFFHPYVIWLRILSRDSIK